MVSLRPTDVPIPVPRFLTSLTCGQLRSRQRSAGGTQRACALPPPPPAPLAPCDRPCHAVLGMLWAAILDLVVDAQESAPLCRRHCC
ncbi:unnamed protein product [Lampetra planeri]